VHHGAQFEVHSTVDGQPVELPQSWCHVFVSVGRESAVLLRSENGTIADFGKPAKIELP